MRAISISFSFVALTSALLSTACSGWPTSPTSLTDRAGFSISIIEVTRPWAPASQLLSVRVEYTLAERLDKATLWTCVARTTDTVIISSCRSSSAVGLAGQDQLSAGIYYVNDVPVVPLTGYVLAFVTSGDLYRDRLYPPLEVKLTELQNVAAHAVLEMSWPWDPLTR